jgi:hypothetical protein
MRLGNDPSKEVDSQLGPLSFLRSLNPTHFCLLFVRFQRLQSQDKNGMDKGYFQSCPLLALMPPMIGNTTPMIPNMITKGMPMITNIKGMHTAK